MQAAPAMALGAAYGIKKGSSVDLQDLPQTVALFHSFVGAAATLTCVGHYMDHVPTEVLPVATGFIGAWVGGVTCTGSIVAYQKLNGTMASAPVNPMGGKAMDVAMLAGSAGSLGYMLTQDLGTGPMAGLACLAVPTVTSMASGWRLAKAVGGADMPVIITTLNSSSGWALAAEGVLLNNNLLTGVGCFIGSSGAFLSLHMCEAMNRKLSAVLFDTFGATGEAKTYEGTATETSVSETLETIDDAQNVIIVPGYGLCAASAQYAIAELAQNLKERGKTFIKITLASTN